MNITVKSIITDMSLQIGDAAGMDWFLVTWERLTQFCAAVTAVFCQEGKWRVGRVFPVSHCQKRVMQGLISYFPQCSDPWKWASAFLTEKSQGTSNRVPSLLLQLVAEASGSSGSRWAYAAHHHPPHVLLPYLSLTKRCPFPSTSQHTPSQSTSAVQEVTHSQGRRRTASGDAVSPPGFINRHPQNHLDAFRSSQGTQERADVERHQEQVSSASHLLDELGTKHQAAGS